MKKINYFGMISLLSLIAILGFITENKWFYGFLGFLIYIRYFFVLPDELFKLKLRKSCTVGFLAQIISIVPLLLISYFRKGIYDLKSTFIYSFAISVLIFSIYLVILEYQEEKGCTDA